MRIDPLMTVTFAALTMNWCVRSNAYEEFYVDNLGGQPVTSIDTLEPFLGRPKVYRGSDYDLDNQKMLQNGFVQIGYSCFDGANSAPSDNLEQAADFGQQKHAAVALLYSKYIDTVTEQVPYQVQTDSSTSTWTEPRRDGRIICGVDAGGSLDHRRFRGSDCHRARPA